MGMYHSFAQVEESLRTSGRRRRVVLAGADDDRALAALLRAAEAGFVEPVLVGSREGTEAALAGFGRSLGDCEFVEATTEMQTAAKALGMIAGGEADIPMKGLMQTSTFLMATKAYGVADRDALTNEYTVFHYADEDRLIVCGDCAVNVAPSLEQKAQIAHNLIGVARALGARPVRAVALSVVERPNPGVPSSVDAADLAGRDWGEDVLFEGPLALDGALDAESARHKGISSQVAGRADVILVPDIHAGNVLHKCAHFFGHYAYSSGLLGAHVPVVMNSRTDDVDAKYNSILMACAVHAGV